MLAFTFAAPVNSVRGPVILVCVLERENLTRMALGDPLDLQLVTMARASDQAAEVLNNKNASDLDIVFAYEDAAGIQKIRDLASRKDMAAVLRYLERGRTIYDGEPAAPKVVNNG